MINLKNKKADIFVPDGTPIEKALKRTTHIAIGAHQDDIEIMAYHGIEACFGNKKLWFGGITVTDGSGSPRAGIYGNYTDDQMKRVRLLEQRKAAYVGEYSFQIQLGYKSKDVKNPENRNIIKDLIEILSKTSINTIYLHNPADKHDTHVAVMLKSIEAIRNLSPQKIKNIKKVYGCETWRDLDWMMDDRKVVLPTSIHENLASALVSIYDSQIAGGKRYDLATLSRRFANATYLSTHEVDIYKSVTYAMDLTPLIKNKDLSIQEYVKNEILLFLKDVEQRINKFQK